MICSCLLLASIKLKDYDCFYTKEEDLTVQEAIKEAIKLIDIEQKDFMRNENEL